MLETSIEKKYQRSAKIDQPAMYALIMLNDDYTPMDFVVDVLKRFIRMNNDTAMRVMLTIHREGEGHCGIYTRDIGETKIAHIHKYAKKHGNPLRCVLRKTEN